ncbi:MAG: hypothetical protein N3B01_11450 [Verrucomicrobiae bacterium]|nr:hypothetical protein [Verrucomicrobiae bacterium]
MNTRAQIAATRHCHGTMAPWPGICAAVLLATVATAAERFEDFRIIIQRNIFNLHRIPQRRDTPSYVRPSYRPGSGDYIALVGTLTYQTNQIAFFDGSSPDYRKAVRPSETVAGYRLVSIRPNSVRLDNNGKSVELRVGMRLSRTDGQITPHEFTPPPPSATVSPPAVAPGTGAVTVAAAPVAAPAATGSSQTPAQPPPVPTVAAPPADPGEILRRLMQRREQETQ